jgi:hypothetical protein
VENFCPGGGAQRTGRPLTSVAPGPRGPGFGYKRRFCKSYRCPDCSIRKLRRLRFKIAESATARKLTKLLTLTLDPGKIPEGTSSPVYLRNCWRKMRVSLQRRTGNSVEFIAVLELQKSGLAHLHVLVHEYLPQAWVSEAWQGVGGGKIVDIRSVDVRRIAGYLAKYLTKGVLQTLPRGTRFFSSSRGLVLWPKGNASGWFLTRSSIEVLRYIGSDTTDERWEDFGNRKKQLVWFQTPHLVPAATWRKVSRRD